MSGKTKHGKPRRHAGVRGVRPDRKADRRAFIVAQQAIWRSFPPNVQLEELDARLGRGLGAKRQRARLAKVERRA